MRCQILNIGSDSGIHGSLRALLEAEGLISVQHIEMGALALEILRKLPESELPHVVIVPFRLADLTALEFVTGMGSHQRLRSVRMVVWGSNVPAHMIERMYRAGAASVVLGQLNTTHLDAMRQFCRDCTETDVRRDERRNAISPALLQSGEKGIRNARLGALFVRTGCISAALWMCSFLPGSRANKKLDFAALPVYAALTCAGFTLRR